MTASVILDHYKVVCWTMQISLLPEVYEWLLKNVGMGDLRFWSYKDDLKDHLTYCHDDTHCYAGQPCNPNDQWGWALDSLGIQHPSDTKPKVRTVGFYFRNPDHAMLFKLTWA